MQMGKTDAILKPCETVRWFHLQQAVGVGACGGTGEGVHDHKNFFQGEFQQGLQQLPPFQQCNHSNICGFMPVYHLFTSSQKWGTKNRATWETDTEGYRLVKERW